MSVMQNKQSKRSQGHMTTAKFNPNTQKRTSQRAMVLNALRNAASKGLANYELYEISQRWAARLQELYKQGYKIRVDNLGDGIHSYTLVEEPAAILPRPERAQDVLTREIESKFGGSVTTAQLLYILQSNKLQVGRKAGTFSV
ncbi:hypothetical protein [Paenibacillus sp. BIC5C1]|uniref:hypothetical protein n=1 Tax=Paenibacillus sp. BIC5C1 TaxID=3078263 RepID=UPI0028E984B4|nr:hypothetical protein [Paenibacillus sp. BIC5C1]